MDAAHFRNRAARARTMAQNGDDIRLIRMLLDVAAELDAEADLIEAEAETRDNASTSGVTYHDLNLSLLDVWKDASS